MTIATIACLILLSFSVHFLYAMINVGSRRRVLLSPRPVGSLNMCDIRAHVDKKPPIQSYYYYYYYILLLLYNIIIIIIYHLFSFHYYYYNKKQKTTYCNTTTDI